MTERVSEDLTPDEEEVGARLAEQRPVPGARFRGALRRHLADRDPGYGPRPARLRPMVAGYVGAGTCLIAVAALVATGVL